MAKSTCMKCGNQSFELMENTPKGSAFKLMFIQCAHCGGVVGVTDYHSAGYIAKKIAEKLDVKL